MKKGLFRMPKAYPTGGTDLFAPAEEEAAGRPQEQDEEAGDPGDEDGEAALGRDGGDDVLVVLAPEGYPGVRLVYLLDPVVEAVFRFGLPGR